MATQKVQSSDDLIMELISRSQVETRANPTTINSLEMLTTYLHGVNMGDFKQGDHKHGSSFHSTLHKSFDVNMVSIHTFKKGKGVKFDWRFNTTGADYHTELYFPTLGDCVENLIEEITAYLKNIT